jgi:predicted methyltransferase
MKYCITFAALLLVGTACKKDEKSEPAAKATTSKPTTESTKVEPAPVADAKAEPTEAERIATALAKLEDSTAKEQARWTPELEAKAVALRDAAYPNAEAALKAIVASEHRTPGNSDRDPHRHPVETLVFFGIAPDQTVVELGAGAGWYTELLAPLLAAKGKLIAVAPDPDGPADKMRHVYGKRLVAFLGKSPALYGKVERVAITPPDQMKLGADGSADLVIAMREMHNWVDDGQLDAFLKAIHTVLKDGGTFGMEAHRAKEGQSAEDAAKLGYLPEPWVIEKVTAAGFELVEKSDINANPKDTKDYKDGVWTLPPALTLGDVDKDKYLAIGESDRMTLKFKKKAAAK